MTGTEGMKGRMMMMMMHVSMMMNAQMFRNCVSRQLLPLAREEPSAIGDKSSAWKSLQIPAGSLLLALQRSTREPWCGQSPLSLTPRIR